jgi:RNA polymerase sigma-B factor
LFERLTAAAEPERDDVRRQIVLVNTGVALAVARRYHGRGIDNEDLDQTACLSLVQAVRTFDPERGHDFMSFAVPTIVGGLKQHFRDLGWTIRVPRRVQEVQLLIDREGLPEADEIRYGVHTVHRLAKHLHLTTREVEAALRARGCFRPTSIDQEGTWPPPRALDADGRYGTEEQDAIELRSVLAPLLDRLPARDRELLRLRFGEDQTQQSIAVQLRLTQAQVSRLLTRVIARLRADLELAEHAAGLGRVVSL